MPEAQGRLLSRMIGADDEQRHRRDFTD
jgi:hypothetical protein